MAVSAGYRVIKLIEGIWAVRDSSGSIVKTFPTRADASAWLGSVRNNLSRLAPRHRYYAARKS
jgi:hypothetical protein